MLPNDRWVSKGGSGLRVRGGGGGARSAGTLLAAAAASASGATAVRAPVEKFRKDYQPPGHWTRLVESSCGVLAGGGGKAA